MKLELNNKTIYIIKDALDYYRQISSDDKQERDRAYSNFLDAFLESARAEENEKEKYKEATSKLNEIIKNHTTSENYYLNFVNKYNADGLEFFTFGSNNSICTISKDKLEDGNITIPKTNYRPYKIINGIKEYIDTNP